MITVFNREEVFTTRDIGRLNAAREALSNAGIEYKTVSASGMGELGRGRGVPFVDQSAMVQYRLFVKKSDAARARGLVRC